MKRWSLNARSKDQSDYSLSLWGGGREESIAGSGTVHSSCCTTHWWNERPQKGLVRCVQ